MADKKPLILGATALKPVERHWWEVVRDLIYNPKNGEYFTRTPKSWALITVFYLIYYSLLFCFWAAMMTIFLQTIPNVEDKVGPKWQSENSIIGVSPGRASLGVPENSGFMDVEKILKIVHVKNKF